MSSGEPTVTRVRLLSGLCGALYYSDERDRMETLSAEATEIATALDDPRATALAAAARRRANWDPDHLQQRLSDSGRLVRAATEAGDIELILQGHAWLAVDLLEQGDVAGVDAQVQAFTAGARDLRQPLYLWQVAIWRAMRALLAGHLSTAERLASEAFSAGIRPESETATQYYAIQLLAIRREQLRMGELEGALREQLSNNAHRPAWRTALATLMIETGRLDDAQSELDRLATARFADIPRDGDWIVTIVLIADVAAAVKDGERSAILHDLLLEFGDRNVVIGLGTVCLGSVSRYLGRLASAFGDRKTARRHLERALEANRNLHASVQLAHTQLDYAQVLGPGSEARALVDAALGTAEELHLPSIVRRGTSAEFGPAAPRA
jgi:tetratricopeptide (TPR) repeat protein